MLKRDSIIMAILSTVVISVLFYLFTLLFPLAIAIKSPGWIILVCLCFLSVYFLYGIRVERKLNVIQKLIAKKPENPRVSLNMLEMEISNLLKERREELEKIEKLERHRREFLGNVSHELKTPLFHIQGYVSTLAENNVDDPALYHRYLDRTEKSIERLIRILDDLDTISQLESEEINPDGEPFDMVELCRDVLESEEMDAKEKNITLHVEPEMEKMAVTGDRFRIRQVIVNLIVNSIKYGKKEGTTRILLKNEGDSVLTEVIDNGIGIAPEHLPRLFERFYRVDKGRSREEGGTGLGLSIAKHILEAHHQNIEVKSTPGAGTVFSFHIKKAPKHSSFST